MRHGLFILTAALGLGLAAGPLAAQDLRLEVADTVAALGATFPEDEVTGFAQALADAPAGVTGDTFGQLLYARRHFDRAAWFFGLAAAGDTADPVSLNNFAGLITEMAAAAPQAVPRDWLETARAAAEAAVALAADVAAFHNTLGNVALTLGDSASAVQALTRASELAPDTPLYWTNLARAFAAAGQTDDAAAALARAHALEPNGLALLAAVAALPETSEAYRQDIGPTCDVNFHCQEICPKSIIGGLMSVTCEMENSSAQMACQAGEPYAVSYNCKEDFPEYGIMIPGLNAGFSVMVPGFTAHVKVNGDGSIDTRVEVSAGVGPVSVYAGGDGHFSPSHDFSTDNFRSGARLSLGPSGSAASAVASALGQPAAHLEVESRDGQPAAINLETFNAGVLSF